MAVRVVEPLAGLTPAERERVELDLLVAQLGRMRAMLHGYSARFFSTIRNWAFLAIVLLAVGSLPGWEGAAGPVAFIVPFAFLESAFLFHYTVFARRHAERLEQAINTGVGRDVLVAHRLEAAFLYPPDAPKIAGLSFGNLGGMFSAATAGYLFGGAILWVAGFVRLLDIADAADPASLARLLPVAALAWTVLIGVYLVWASIARDDEDRLMAELERSYPLGSGARRGPAEGLARPAPGAARRPAVVAGPPAATGPRAAPLPTAAQPTVARTTEAPVRPRRR